jgi:hypothetical protein
MLGDVLARLKDLEKRVAALEAAAQPAYLTTPQPACGDYGTQLAEFQKGLDVFVERVRRQRAGDEFHEPTDP